jgi:hypothetical protein
MGPLEEQGEVLVGPCPSRGENRRPFFQGPLSLTLTYSAGSAVPFLRWLGKKQFCLRVRVEQEAQEEMNSVPEGRAESSQAFQRSFQRLGAQSTDNEPRRGPERVVELIHRGTAGEVPRRRR